MMYIRNSVPYHHWSKLDVVGLETMWVTLTPVCLPRGTGSITVGLIYHPPKSKDKPMINHIFTSLDYIRRNRPESAILLCGDFNQLKDQALKNQLQLRLLVKKPTRNAAILDKVFTTIGQYYGEPDILAPIGLSDHSVVLCRPALAKEYRPRKVIMATTRCTGANEKAMLAAALRTTRWEDLYNAPSCMDQYNLCKLHLMDVENTHLPLKQVRRCSNDMKWVTDEFRNLTAGRNQAFHRHPQLYRLLRNKANRMRKRLRKSYYRRKIEGVAQGGSEWWRNVSDISGLKKSSTGLQGLANSVCGGNMCQLSELANNFFHSINSDFVPPQENDINRGPHVIPDKYIISVQQVEARLSRLNPRKGSGPDGIPTWILREYAHLLSKPVCAIYNSSLRESFLPPVWRCSTIIPIPKCNPPRTVDKDLRPISLTGILAKELEYFVCQWVMDLAR